MRLVSVSVDKYRSITRAPKIRLGHSTILVGPNNEGKSNILRALVTGMNILTNYHLFRFSSEESAYLRSMYRRYYDWDVDFPLSLQAKHPNGQSVIILEFALDEKELEQFAETIKSNLNGTLPIRMALGQKGPQVTVHKQGPGSKALSAKSDQIAEFVADRIELQHIPAIRTARSAEEIVEEMVARELRTLEKDDAYARALGKIEELQKPLLDTLSKSIKDTLVTFLPAVRDVRVQIRREDRYRAMRRACQIVVDDGTPTLLQYKGDGAQSLAALGMMRHASERGARGRYGVIAIEEPESHLHPRAIHEFRKVLFELSETHQVLVTTHNPLFVDRVDVASNVIVHKNKAVPAKTLEQVRQILGVRAADNLQHAELVLIVEGEEDRLALKALLPVSSALLKAALASGSLTIDSLHGAGKLTYKLSLLRDALCLYHCFLDDDQAGRTAFDQARVEGLLSDPEVHFTTCDGMAEAELEDLYDPAAYASVVKNRFGVLVDTPKFHTARKWSVRLRDTFKGQGKQWDDRVEKDLKRAVAEVVSSDPSKALLAQKRSAFDSLAAALSDRLLAIRAPARRPKDAV